MNHKHVGTALLLIGLLSAIPSLYAITTSFLVPTNGSISMVKLYWDSNCTSQVTHVDWGSIIPGTTVNQTCYIKNFGSVPVNITLQALNWTTNPEAANYTASSYIAFTYVIAGGQTIPPNTGVNVQQTVLYLTVSSNVTSTNISTFSFNIQVNEGW